MAPSFPLGSKSHHVYISCKKGLTEKQKEDVYGKCKNEGVTGIEQVYEYENNDGQLTNSKRNPYACAMLNDFKFFNAHAESAEIENFQKPE